MKVLFDDSGENYSVMRVEVPVGTMLQYTLLPEHQGEPVDLVHYLEGVLTRVGPDGVVESDHEAGVAIPEFTKVGAYTFVVRQTAVWDCLSLWAGVEGKRLTAEIHTDTTIVEGDVFLAEGTWLNFGTHHESPKLLKGVSPAVFELTDGPGRLYSDIRLEDL